MQADPAVPPLPALINGSGPQAHRWWRHGAAGADRAQVLVLLAATETAAVPGISAAGSTPESRRRTAAADAELLLLGPEVSRPHALPPLPAGVSPALISRVVTQTLALPVLVLDLGLAVAPAVPHLRLRGQDTAACLSSGRAMPAARVHELIAAGERLGRRWASRPQGRPLVLAACVPGGTSTALATLLGLGIDAAGRVSGSLHIPAHDLKEQLARRGLEAAGLTPGAGSLDPVAVLAAVGDPMQAMAIGLLQAVTAAEQPVLLAGGSQMAAVLALALALATDRDQRQRLATQVAIGTTGWVARETGSDLATLLAAVGDRFGVSCLALASDLRFDQCQQQALRDYERGFVKEGVGAGGLALLWQRSGRTITALAEACDQACAQLLGAAPSGF
ncbi:MAG: nicotinate mononucleotide-dependent phosphoribosyltransferase CobT [Cyanobacteriota bacterium]